MSLPTSISHWGDGLSQDDMMVRDTVIVVDDNDTVLGSASKKESHIFSSSKPHGTLHRAFSVFIFETSNDKLLLHKRAASKITFPNVSFLGQIILDGQEDGHPGNPYLGTMVLDH
jgi:hypothetical protein